MQCSVKAIKPLASSTYQILLHPEQAVEFKAGQYLLVVMSEQDKRPFSIASSPCRHQGELELHIGAAEENPYALEVVEMMQQALVNQTDIQIDAPHGSAFIQEESTRPILLIAGGTGFSYVRSILDHCIAQQKSNPIYLYWGAKSEDQLYDKEQMQIIAAQYQNIHFIPVVEGAPTSWQGKIGNVLDAVEEDFSTLADFDIYVAGRFEMASAAREAFIKERQAKRERIFADAFAFI